MPPPFIDLPQQIDTLQLLIRISTDLKTKGILFNKQKDIEIAPILDSAITDLRRLYLLREMYLTGIPATAHITCDACATKCACLSSYDIYNLDGACLSNQQ